MKELLWAVLLSVVLSWPVSGFAEEKDLVDKRLKKESAQKTVEKMDEITVTATRSEENVNKIPAKVEVIGSREIELTTGSSLTEQLKKNASVSVIEYGTDLTGIGIRGFRPEYSGITKHSLVLIDGRPAGATNLASILSDNIERIEVLKGPASYFGYPDDGVTLECGMSLDF